MSALRIDEVIQVAIQLEEAGMAFYEVAAAEAPDPDVRALCKQLSEDEHEHLKTFCTLREETVTKPGWRRLEVEEMSIIQELVDAMVLPSNEQARQWAREGTPTDTLDRAIRMEEDSVTLYKRLMSGVNDTETLHHIIDEEKQHIEQLSQVRRQMT
jgi:rubrerythrin